MGDFVFDVERGGEDPLIIHPMGFVAGDRITEVDISLVRSPSASDQFWKVSLYPSAPRM